MVVPRKEADMTLGFQWFSLGLIAPALAALVALGCDGDKNGVGGQGGQGGSGQGGGDRGGDASAGGASQGGGGGSGGTSAGGGGAGGIANAESAFWKAFHAERYDQLTDVTAELDAAYTVDATADDTLLDAHARLWRLAEWGRDPTQDTSQIPGIALTAEARFKQAQALAPDDARIAGWLGPLEMNIGEATNDPSRVALGQMILDQGVTAYPEFNLFVRGLVTMSLPATDPSYAPGIDAFWQNLDACYGEPVDRQHLDISIYAGQETHTGAKRVCWNGEMDPHNLEGFFLYMGDAFIKTGDATTATLAWSQAQKSASYAAWPFKADLEARLQSADAWAALFDDQDPSNDPVLINASATNCAACHASK
jgi:hypothetical protein